MQKVTEFLEKNVEWLALGFGGLFLLYMVYAYVLSTPVSVQAGNQSLTLGEIDRHILQNQARTLEREMDPNRPPPADLSQFPALAESFRNRMTRQGQTVATLPPIQVFGPQITEIPIGGPDGGEQIQVTALPTLPKPIAAMKVAAGVDTKEPAVRKGNSSVLIPQAPGNLAAGQQGGPAVIQVQAGANAQGTDRLWVSMLYRIQMKAVAEAFTKSQLFQAAPGSQTAFLVIEVEREEKLPNGQWGNPRPVPLLKNTARPPVPAETAANPQAVDASLVYINWAALNTVEVLKPAFYAVLAGTPWIVPGDPDVVVPEETPEQRAARAQAQKELERQEKEARRQQSEQRRSQRQSERGPGRAPRGGMGGPGGPGGEDYRPAPIDRDRPRSNDGSDLPFMQVQPGRGGPPQGYPPGYPGGPPGGYPGGYPGGPPGGYPGGYPGMPPEMMPPEAMGQPNPNQPAAQLIPPEVLGRFQPAATMPDVDFWFHDDTAEAGKTYRYRVRYRMANPILGWTNVANPPELQNQVYVSSEWSEWSQPVGMNSLVQYFAAGTGVGGAEKVRFEVFKWEKGAWQSHSFANLGPGDMIGDEKNNVDYRTGVTVVDIRRDHQDRQVVVLVDADGNQITRSVSDDMKGADYRELQKKVQEDKARQQANPPQANAR